MVGIAIAIAVLYFARELLIPFAFALLLAFLLGPILKRLESWHIPRIPAALLVFVFTVPLLTVVGWVMANQFIQIVRSLPRYSDNVRRKVVALQGGSTDFSEMMEQPRGHGEADARSHQGTSGGKRGGDTGQAPIPVEDRGTARHGPEHCMDYGGQLLAPLGRPA